MKPFGLKLPIIVHAFSSVAYDINVFGFRLDSFDFNSFADIESKLKRIEDDPEGSGTTHLFKLMQGVNSRAILAFEPLFERQVDNLEKFASIVNFNVYSHLTDSLLASDFIHFRRKQKK